MERPVSMEDHLLEKNDDQVCNQPRKLDSEKYNITKLTTAVQSTEEQDGDHPWKRLIRT